MAALKWYKNPEMIVALSALLIGIVTAFTSIYSAYIDRSYAKASVWPRLELFRSHDANSFKYVVANNGTGPALIKYAKVKYQDRFVQNWVDIEGFSGFTQSHINTRSLAAQKVIQPLVYTGDKASEFVVIDESISIELCYCSIYDECWVIDRNNSPENVNQCQVETAERFLQ